MVLRTVPSPPAVSYPDSDGQTDSDGESVASSTADEPQGAVVLHEDDGTPPPCFGNVAISNSSDVHFGNKTFYHGPVTIKQFLYANGRGGDATRALKAGDLPLDPAGLDNPAFGNELDGSTLVTFKEHPDASVNAAGAGGATGDSSRVAKGFKWIRSYSQQHLFVVISLLAVLMVSLAILMVVLLVRHSPQSQMASDDKPYVPKEDTDEQSISQPLDPPVDPAVNLTLPPKLKIVTRREWVGQPPIQDPNNLTLPVPYVIIMHTATENCTSRAQCNFNVRYIQMFHIESNNWWDIGYNFLVGGDGNAYEGRGWTAEGAHTYGYNARSIGIAFIGTFEKYMPPKIQMTACKQLIEKGLEMGYISKNYKLLAARQLQSTISPGKALYEEIKTWPHWSPSP